MRDSELECHAVDNISLALRKDGQIEINLISKSGICHNVFGKDAARSIAAALDDIASGRIGRYIAADSSAETIGEIDMDDDPHFLINGDDDEFVIFSREKDQLYGYASDRNDPAIIAVRDVLRMWTA